MRSKGGVSGTLIAERQRRKQRALLRTLKRATGSYFFNPERAAAKAVLSTIEPARSRVIFERAARLAGERGRRCRQDFSLGRKPKLIGLTVYAIMRGPDLVRALANEVFQVLIHVRGSRLSDV
jgi:hypothetical protein